MVSGSKQKVQKKKEKMVFAKDKKQVIIMVAVLSVLGANTVYMLVKYIQDQMPQTNTATQNAQIEQKGEELNPTAPKTENMTKENPQLAKTGATQTSTGTPQPIQSAEAPSFFPFIPAILILIAIIIGAFIAKKFLNNNSSSSDPRQKDSSKKPGKLLFAKDKKQVVIMSVVVALFLTGTVYMIFKYVQNQLPQKPSQASATLSPEDQMAQQQQKDLQSLNNPNQPDDAAGTNNDIGPSQDANNIYMQTMNQQGNAGHPPVSDNLKTIQSSEGDVDILVKNKDLKRSSKMVFVSVSNSGRSNPFLPANENVLPPSLSYLAPPPEVALKDSDAGKVMSTTISGILYDKNNPSAIINIEGADYLVKTGDTIHNYKVLSITQNQVLVQLGKNIYKAGVGELLSETDLNYNVIANLNKKFGGNNVPINVRKRR